MKLSCSVVAWYGKEQSIAHYAKLFYSVHIIMHKLPIVKQNKLGFESLFYSQRKGWVCETLPYVCVMWWAVADCHSVDLLGPYTYVNGFRISLDTTTIIATLHVHTSFKLLYPKIKNENWWQNDMSRVVGKICVSDTG